MRIGQGDFCGLCANALGRYLLRSNLWGIEEDDQILQWAIYDYEHLPVDRPT